MERSFLQLLTSFSRLQLLRKAHSLVTTVQAIFRLGPIRLLKLLPLSSGAMLQLMLQMLLQLLELKWLLFLVVVLLLLFSGIGGKRILLGDSARLRTILVGNVRRLMSV